MPRLAQCSQRLGLMAGPVLRQRQHLPATLPQRLLHDPRPVFGQHVGVG